MTQGMNFPAAAGLPVTSRPEAKPALKDVGRDRYFLNALQGIGAAEGTKNAMHAIAQEHASLTSGHDITVTFSHAETAIECAENAKPSSAHTAFATHTPGATARRVPIPKPVTAIGNAAFAATPLTRMPPNTAGPAAAPQEHIDHRSPAFWLPQNITLRETDDGVDVIARNFFLDSAGRRQLAMRILQDLGATGKSPRQLTLNGEVIWRAENIAQHTQATGSH